MTLRSPVRSRFAPPACGVLLAAALVRPSFALGPCRVTLQPPGAALSWRQASTEAMRHIESLPTETRDCRDVLVEVREHDALVTMTTRDGRAAQRPILHPADLAPTVSALITTVAMPSTMPNEEEARQEERPPPATADIAPPARDVASHTSSVPIESPGHFVVAGAAGARWGTPNRLLGPLLQVTAGLALAHWELGVFAEVEPLHSSSYKVPDGFKMWSAGAGIAAGARIPAGAFAIVGGARLGAGIVSETATTEGEGNAQDAAGDQAGSIGGAVAELLTGLYGGAVWPARNRFRVRSQLLLDATPTRLGATRTIDPALPPLPAWSLTLQLGVEGEVL